MKLSKNTKSKHFFREHWSHLLVILFIAGWAGMAVFFARRGYFSITDIQCQLSNQPCPDYLTAEWEKFFGQSFFFTDFTSEQAKITRILPSITDIHISKQFPGKLIITCNQAPPVYALQKDAAFYIIDQTGTISDVTATPSSLLTINVTHANLPNIEIHQSLPPTLHQHLQNLSAYLAVHPLRYQHIELENTGDLSIQLDNMQYAILRADNAENDIAKLQYVLNTVDFHTFAHPISRIDVRFKYPVLIPQEKSSPNSLTKV